MDILRFITAGNVDDGKSTLIGRLLYDTGNIKTDILRSVHSDNDEANLAYITDGLRSERAQGITIDVAYKYFNTHNRKYIITDAPGHFQYTRNLVTGASNADAIIILIDASTGITDQTKRHSLIAWFLNIKQIIVAINKMDVANYAEDIYENIQREYSIIAKHLQLRNVTYIPISALKGDNVITRSTNMQWYSGRTLMDFLETCAPVQFPSTAVRFNVQYPIYSGAKAYAGRILAGTINVGDHLYTENSLSAIVRRITKGYLEVSRAGQGDDVVLFVDSDKIIERGEVLFGQQNAPTLKTKFTANVCWFDDSEGLQPKKKYLLRLNSKTVACRIEVMHKINFRSIAPESDQHVHANDFAKINIHIETSIAFDNFKVIPAMGRAILIDPDTNYTCGALTIIE
jgi:sulfate adenylyltransferase subunit 1